MQASIKYSFWCIVLTYTIFSGDGKTGRTFDFALVEC